MKISYKFVNGEANEIEVNDELGEVVLGLDRKEYNNIDLQIDSKLAQVARLRELAEKVTVTLSTQPKGSSVRKRTEECVLKIWELERSINADIDKLVDMKDTAKILLDQIPDERYRQILELRYLNGMKFKDIARKMCYAERWIRKMHTCALEYLKQDRQRPLET